MPWLARNTENKHIAASRSQTGDNTLLNWGIGAGPLSTNLVQCSCLKQHEMLALCPHPEDLIHWGRCMLPAWLSLLQFPFFLLTFFPHLHISPLCSLFHRRLGASCAAHHALPSCAWEQSPETFPQDSSLVPTFQTIILFSFCSYVFLHFYVKQVLFLTCIHACYLLLVVMHLLINGRIHIAKRLEITLWYTMTICSFEVSADNHLI